MVISPIIFTMFHNYVIIILCSDLNIFWLKRYTKRGRQIHRAEQKMMEFISSNEYRDLLPDLRFFRPLPFRPPCHYLRLGRGGHVLRPPYLGIVCLAFGRAALFSRETQLGLQESLMAMSGAAANKKDAAIIAGQRYNINCGSSSFLSWAAKSALQQSLAALRPNFSRPGGGQVFARLWQKHCRYAGRKTLLPQAARTRLSEVALILFPI
jgi:hypothetical protein